MERMTLREAAARTSRSITTLRRYIRSGRLHAEKRYGRFGPEYFVSARDLVEAGLDPNPPEAPRPASKSGTNLVPRAGELSNGLLREIVPLSLFQELQMKHEQLLVQYGMVRAGGLQVMQLRNELETNRKELLRSREANRELKRQLEKRGGDSRQELRRANLELQGRRLEIDALHEKVTALEMLTRNAVTNETIDRQYRDLLEQRRKIDRLDSRQATTTPEAEGSRPTREPEH